MLEMPSGQRMSSLDSLLVQLRGETNPGKIHEIIRERMKQVHLATEHGHWLRKIPPFSCHVDRLEATDLIVRPE